GGRGGPGFGVDSIAVGGRVHRALNARRRREWGEEAVRRDEYLAALDADEAPVVEVDPVEDLIFNGIGLGDRCGIPPDAAEGGEPRVEVIGRTVIDVVSGRAETVYVAERDDPGAVVEPQIGRIGRATEIITVHRSAAAIGETNARGV